MLGTCRWAGQRNLFYGDAALQFLTVPRSPNTCQRLHKCCFAMVNVTYGAYVCFGLFGQGVVLAAHIPLFRAFPESSYVNLNNDNGDWGCVQAPLAGCACGSGVVFSSLAFFGFSTIFMLT